MIDNFVGRTASLLGPPDSEALHKLITRVASLPTALLQHWSQVGGECLSLATGGSILRHFRLLGPAESLQLVLAYKESAEESGEAGFPFSQFVPFAEGMGTLGTIVQSGHALYRHVVEIEPDGFEYLVHSTSIEDYLDSVYAVAILRASMEPFEAGRIYSRMEFEVFAKAHSFCAAAMYADATWLSVDPLEDE